MPRLRLIPTATLALTLAGAAGVASAPALPAKAQLPIRFATPTVVDPVDLYGEPDLRQDPAHPNQWFASGPWGTGVQRSIWNRSTDGTHTFRELHDRPDPVHTGGSMLPPGGGDTEIALDQTGKLYMADLAALQTQKAYTSTDSGASFSEQPLPPVFEDNNGTDRQWLSIWDPPDPSRVQSAYKGPFPVAYMTFLKAGLAGTVGGETTASSVPAAGGDSSRVGLDYACEAGAMGGSQCPIWQLSGDGYTVIDQLTGTVLQAIAIGDDTKGTAGVGLEVVKPGADGYMKTATQQTVAQLGDHNVGSIFPVAAMDAQRNAYVVWVSNPVDGNSHNHYKSGKSWQVFYSWSPPGPNNDWKHWSAPRRISRGPSNTSVMPWVVGGGNGNIDVAWYGTSSTLQQFDSAKDSAVANASWYVYFAQVLGAASSSPQITQQLGVDHPMHHGSICLAGLGCITETGNRNMADFFEITTDASGAAYIVYNNTANDLIQQVPIVEAGVPEGVIDHRGAAETMVVRQVSGTTLLGTSIDRPTDRNVDGMTSAAGDAFYDPVSGSSSFPGFDLEGTSVTLAGDHLHATLLLNDPNQISAGLQAIAAPFYDLVLRWEFNSVLYFAAVEVNLSGTSNAVAWDGGAQSIDLCSVSACDPHMIVYPGPTVAPLTSHLLSGATFTNASGTTPGSVTLDIPLADVGSPKAGDHLDSVGAYSLVSSTSYLVPFNNVLAEADVVPQEVDGTCCFTPVLGSAAAPNPVAAATMSAVQGGGSASPTGSAMTPNTAAPSPARGAGAVAMIAAAVLRVAGRRVRRR